MTELKKLEDTEEQHSEYDVEQQSRVITEIKEDSLAIWYTIEASPEILRYIVEKGSVAIDGISLTVAKVTQTTFSVSTIPHTRKITTLGERKKGDMVNLEMIL